jgi:hypothetical protein
MNSELYFKINAPSIIWEVIETEIIVINMDNGYYYDVSGLSASIWRMIENGLSYVDIINEIAHHYNKSVVGIQPDINFFLCTLEEENLIVRIDEKGTALVNQVVDLSGVEYTPPALKKYTDMENLLLIDPIHEVDEHGWPNRYPLPHD